MRIKLAAVLAVAILTISGSAFAAPTTLTFSEFPVGTTITTQYPGVIFSQTAFPFGPIIANDGAMPNSPVLSVDPPYAGIFGWEFPSGATGVSFDSGYWNTLGSGVIFVFSPKGILLANLTNTTLGVDTIDLSSYGTIGFVSFDSGQDPFGADIDNLKFTNLPEPGTLIMFGSGIIGLAGVIRRKINM